MATFVFILFILGVYGNLLFILNILISWRIWFLGNSILILPPIVLCRSDKFGLCKLVSHVHENVIDLIWFCSQMHEHHRYDLLRQNCVENWHFPWTILNWHFCFPSFIFCWLYDQFFLEIIFLAICCYDYIWINARYVISYGILLYCLRSSASC